MERLTFLLSSAAFCLLVTVALSSAMTTDCLCDGLPGNQCDYCETDLTHDGQFGDPIAMQGQYYAAWEEEHEDFHHQWVEMHREFHDTNPTEEEDAAFHTKMDDAHSKFHGILQGSATNAL